MKKEEEDKQYVSRSEVQTCCICGIAVHGYGHNASPVAAGRCCDGCNDTVVVPTRIVALYAARGAASGKNG